MKALRFCILIKLLAGISMLTVGATSGTDRKSSLVHQNLERNFHIHIPSTFNKDVRSPLVIALHGRGGNAESMILITRKGFNKLSDSDGFLVVYPEGIEFNWNDDRIDETANDRAHRENIDDVGFISDLIDFMITEYNIDPKRVYVTGISNGAIMAYRLACELSGKIIAIAPVDGNIPYMLSDNCPAKEPVSVLAINGVNDPLVPYSGGQIYGHFHRVRLGMVLSADESTSFWANRDRCSPVPVFTEEPDRDPKDGTTVTKKVYSNGINGAEVILYTVNGGGHTWPGGLQYLPAWLIGKTCRDFDADEVIWSFFKKHTR